MGGVEPPIQSSHERIEPHPVLPSGIESGLVAGLVVAGVFLVRDVLAGVPLQTPSMLGTLLLEGPEAARVVASEPAAAMVFHTLHFIFWVIAGCVASALIGRVERSPRSWFEPWLAVGVMFFVAIGLDSRAAAIGLPRLHIWLGAVAGVATLAAFFQWRHPHAMARVRGFGSR